MDRSETDFKHGTNFISHSQEICTELINKLINIFKMKDKIIQNTSHDQGHIKAFSIITVGLEVNMNIIR